MRIRMKINTRQAACALALMAATQAVFAAAQTPATKDKVLIVLSSESILPLKDGKTFEAGYYLNELIIPAQRFAAADGSCAAGHGGRAMTGTGDFVVAS
jgi:hypothetical protein